MPTEDRFDFLDLREEPPTSNPMSAEVTQADTCSWVTRYPCTDACCF